MLKSNWRIYLTASLMILLALGLLSGCRGQATLTGTASPETSPRPTRTLTASPTRSATGRPAQATSTGRPALPKTSPTMSATSVPTHAFTPPPEVDLGAEAGDLQGIYVRFWLTAADQSEDALRQLLIRFNTSNAWGVWIEPTFFGDYGALAERVETGLQNGDLPDLLAAYPDQARAWNRSGKMLVDLSAYLDDAEWGLTAAEQADFIQPVWQNEIDPAGRRLGMPLHRAGLVLVYNQTWAKALGFRAAPLTPAEFERQACAAARALSNNLDSLDNTAIAGQGGWLVGNEPGLLAAWITAFGGQLTRPGADVYQFNSPEALQAAQFLKGLQTEGCAWQAVERYALAEFAGRRALFLTASTASLPALVNALQNTGNSDAWSVLPIPSEDQPVLSLSGPSLYMPVTAPAQQLAAWAFSRWLLIPENLAEWTTIMHGLPTRPSAAALMAEAAASSPQWQAAVDLMIYAQAEPALASWGLTRWAVNEAAAQLFSAAFPTDQIPDLLDTLDALAGEIQATP